jgi:hypothetical protein
MHDYCEDAPMIVYAYGEKSILTICVIKLLVTH